MGLFDWLLASEAKREAMDRVEAHAEPVWKDDMMRCVEDVCRTHRYFTSDDVVRLAVDRGQWHGTHEKRALGPVMMKAAKLNLCIKAPLPPIASARRSLHASPRAVWQSLVMTQ